MWHPDGEQFHGEAAKCTRLRHQDSRAELHSRLLHTASSPTVDHVRKSSPVLHASANLGQDGLGSGPITRNDGRMFSSFPVKRSCQIKRGRWAALVPRLVMTHLHGYDVTL